MANWKDLWKDILTSPAEERRSFAGLCVLILGIWIGVYGYQKAQESEVKIVANYYIPHSKPRIKESKLSPKKENDFRTKSSRQLTSKKGEFNRKKQQKSIVIDLNVVDLESLPIAGWKLPLFLQQRIIKYRDLLGGFTHLEQLKEVYGIQFELLQKGGAQFVFSGKVNCLALNELSFKALLRHPYFEKEDVQTIFTHRKEGGGFKSVEELKLVLGWTEEEENRISPYLCDFHDTK